MVTAPVKRLKEIVHYSTYKAGVSKILKSILPHENSIHLFYYVFHGVPGISLLAPLLLHIASLVTRSY